MILATDPNRLCLSRHWKLTHPKATPYGTPAAKLFWLEAKKVAIVLADRTFTRSSITNRAKCDAVYIF